VKYDDAEQQEIECQTNDDPGPSVFAKDSSGQYCTNDA
jgi:hypothetical protein